MKKIFVTLTIILSISLPVFPDQVEINAQNVTADDKSGITVFSGKVSITRGKDLMKADNIIVYLTKEKEVEKFEAKGNTSIYIVSEEGQAFKGKSDEFIYWPLKQLFKLKGNAEVEDITNNRKLIGNEIIFDEKTKLANVTGEESKPVKVIFNVKEKDKEKKK